MPTPHRNAALGKLDSQLRTAYPGIVIGWIADRNHNKQSDHQADADGTVDALDPMIGPHFTDEQAESVVAALVASRDPRIGYIIWRGRIISSTVQPWKWRKHTGPDPHTGHFHISSDQEHEDSAAPWTITTRRKPMQYEEYTVRTPIITYGTTDADYDGYNMIARVQDRLGIKEDGIFLNQTRDAIKGLSTADEKFSGNTIDSHVYRRLFGLAWPVKK